MAFEDLISCLRQDVAVNAENGPRVRVVSALDSIEQVMSANKKKLQTGMTICLSVGAIFLYIGIVAN